ncbi:hypothetical protein BB559_007256 [Furculomyces boomerangus]|uniref:Peroxisomal membrane protein PEX14 n=2 Tax=Harpellales TaxID=61421 RepID=A0A2T9XY27_9FUNG|nr:hypothetical protein BB559_007256 [Furculomyces boomerangus]PVZ96644.1 hypothetical protein BB558_007435 [Smittium angustum]
MSAPREDVVNSAVRFLSDPKVQSASLAKQISFLETKGLTSQEIERALEISKLNEQTSPETNTTLTSTNSNTSSNPLLAQNPQYSIPNNPYQAYPPPPPRPKHDWKDFFIAAVIASGLGYGLYEFTKRILIPYFTNSKTQKLEEGQDEIKSSLAKTLEQLENISSALNRTATSIEESNKNFGTALERIEKLSQTMLDEAQQSKLDSNLDVENKLSELSNAISEATNKISGKNSSTSISDLQSELRSMKALLITKRVPPPSSVVTPTTTATNIPAFSSPSQFTPTPSVDLPSSSVAADLPGSSAVVSFPVPQHTENQSTKSSTVEELPESNSQSTDHLASTVTPVPEPEKAVEVDSTPVLPTTSNPSIPAWQLST